MGWKDRFAYNSKNFVEHKVNDNLLRFYPNRIGLLADLGEISKPIGKALATLFSGSRSDSTSVQESYRDKPRKDPRSGLEVWDSSVEKITVEAVSPEVADHRRKERDGAIDELLAALTDQRNSLLFGRLLMDSLREEFEYKKDRPGAEVEEFLFGDKQSYQGLDLPLMSQLVMGWLKANSKVFGDVGEKVTGLVRGRLEALQGRSPSEAKTSTDDGSSSRMLSLVPSDSDSSSDSSSS